MAKRNGDNSYKKVFKTTYGMNKDDITHIQKYAEYYLEIRLDEIAIETPLSFLRPGMFINGKLSSDGYKGYYWERTISNPDNRSYDLRLVPAALGTNDTFYNGYGFSVRCVAK